MTQKPHTDETSEWWYSACCYCTAKWFAPFPHAQCPRCGCTSGLSERLDPPWSKSNSVVPSNDEKRSS